MLFLHASHCLPNYKRTDKQSVHSSHLFNGSWALVRCLCTAVAMKVRYLCERSFKEPCRVVETKKIALCLSEHYPTFSLEVSLLKSRVQSRK
ncbi:hypothetical protein Ddc_15430 [Ditylenchus destructor]|nr:hypothetical protein Ddc_15430 [Ditylenchus destructor]